MTERQHLGAAVMTGRQQDGRHDRPSALRTAVMTDCQHLGGLS